MLRNNEGFDGAIAGDEGDTQYHVRAHIYHLVSDDHGMVGACMVPPTTRVPEIISQSAVSQFITLS